MRTTLPFAALLLLASCGDPAPATDTTVPAKDTLAPVAVNWTGYYTGTLPCADCSGIETTLWVRSDSSFVLQQKYLGRDSIPTGTFGQWHVVQGLMTVGS